MYVELSEFKFLYMIKVAILLLCWIKSFIYWEMSIVFSQMLIMKLKILILKLNFMIDI